MKPFYRILTYLVLVLQSFVILLLLVEKKQEGGNHSVVCAAKPVNPKVAGTDVDHPWALPLLPPQLLFFKLHYCKG